MFETLLFTHLSLTCLCCVHTCSTHGFNTFLTLFAMVVIGPILSIILAHY